MVACVGNQALVACTRQYHEWSKPIILLLGVWSYQDDNAIDVVNNKTAIPNTKVTRAMQSLR